MKAASLFLILSLTASMAVSCAQASPEISADEVSIAKMLDDQKLSEEEQKSIAELMKTGGYYGIRVKFCYEKDQNKSSHTYYVGATPDRMETIKDANRFFPSGFELQQVQVKLLKNPTKEVAESAQKTADSVIQKVFDDISAIKNKYTELAKFDEENVKLKGSSLYYSPNKPGPRERMGMPTISISFGEPGLGYLPQIIYRSELFPAQKLELSVLISCDNDELRKRIQDIVTRDSEPLVQGEIALDSYPTSLGF